MGLLLSTKDAVFFVGGRGTQAGNASSGGCTKAFWGDIESPSKSLSDVMGANGEPLSNVLARLGDAACDVVNNGSGKVRITKAAQGYFPSCVAGLFAGVDFNATYTDGWYEVLDNDSVNDDWIDIDLAYSAVTTCAATVGGALPSLQNALDLADASSVNVYVLDNKDETTLAATIDVDVHSGTASTRVFVKGMNATCTAEAEIELSTDQDLAGNALEVERGLLAFVGMDYLTFSYIDFNCGGKDASLGGYGIYGAGAGDGHYCAFHKCKFRGAEFDGARHPGGYTRFFGCEMSLNGRYGFNGATSSPVGLYGCKIHDNDNHGIYIRPSNSSIIGNLIYDNGKDGSGNGIHHLAGSNWSVYAHNTIYGNDNGDGIQMHALDYGCVYFNNTSVGNGTHGFDLAGMNIGDFAFFGFNHAHGNTTHYSEGADGTFANFGNANNQTGDPLFTSVVDGSEDFTPASGSDLINNGLAAAGSNTDIGAIQETSGGGGGGLLTHPGMSGGMRG